MTSFKLLTPPAAEPVTLDEARLHMRVDATADDALLAGLITAARQWAENYTGRAFIAQTWQLWLDALPDAGSGTPYICVPRPPLLSVTSVATYDDADTATIRDAADYQADTAHEPGRIALRRSLAGTARPMNGIGITYVAGYGAEGSAVPPPIRTAILHLAAHWYDHRGDTADITAPPVPLPVTALLAPYRIKRL
ncbi:MAG: head-tail connector protein [Bdellovibrionales bacterium]